MANNDARLKNQHIFKNQTVFPARFDKQVEDDQVLAEFKFYKKLINIKKINTV